MEAVHQVVGEVIKILMESITRHVGYVTSYTTLVTNMENRMNHLEAKRSEVQQHMDRNKINNLEIPPPVNGWLEEVETIKKDVNSISSNNHVGCFNIKKKYQTTKKSMKATQKIEVLIEKNRDISWSDGPKPLGRIDSIPVFAPAPAPTPSSSGGGGDTQIGFKSRDVTFNYAMKLLQQGYDKAQVIALCGMGGVGKTTMMEQLKEVATNKKMCDWIVKIVIGRYPNLHSIQNAIAVYTGINLPDTTNTLVRADLLCERFKKVSEEGQKKILVILDDVWEKVDLKGIGLVSPLPNGFKLLLTSRNENFCRKIAIDVDSVVTIVPVKVLDDGEALSLFSRITGVSEDSDTGKYKIGCNILKKCGGLPLAIKLIATTLTSKDKFAWENAHDRLRNNDLDKDLQEIIEISYTSLEEEDRETFLVCGLFPEHFNIQIEDLTKYAWGRRLFKGVSTLRETRNRTRTCVSNLKNANLLINGDNDYSGCVKMHNLVLAFVVGCVSNGEAAWIIEHGDMSRQNTVKMNESCKCVSLSCNGMSEFPGDFKFPNVSVLKLMQGDKSLSFPSNFYEEMGSLEVIAYEEMKYPMVIARSHYFTNLRTLCLHKCSLMFDCSSIGNLLYLEVLSFAKSGIQKLPSTISNLKKLRLLDLTGSINLNIDDGVLKNLVKLEELCMRLGPKKKGFKFTIDIWKEIAEISNKLFALEIELFKINFEETNISFDKLESFKISMGCYLEEENEKMRSDENTLRFVTNREELLKSRMNELFKITDVLHLHVDGMIDLEDVDVKPLRPQNSSFSNLRVLVVSHCQELRSLFKFKVTTSLSNLEHLEIKNCPKMEELVYIDCDEAQKFTFPKMKSLTLSSLPKITSIFPIKMLATYSESSHETFAEQPFLSEQVVIPKLEKLCIDDMENLKEIWPCQFTSSEKVNVSLLREIKVTRCDRLENLFPSNPMSSLQRLEEIEVEKCSSIKVVFDIDMDCVGEIEENNGGSKLRSIKVSESRNLREIWRVKGVNNSDIIGFEALERIRIYRCESFRNVFTPITLNFHLRSLTDIEIIKTPFESIQEQKINNISKEEEILRVGDNNISNVAVPSYLVHNFYHLHDLDLAHFEGAEVVFEIDSRELATSHITKQPLPLLPYLENLCLNNMERMSHVWKCKSNWKKFLILEHQIPQPSFHNLTTISLKYCASIKYLFSPLMAELFSNLKVVTISNCDSIKKVVSSRYDDEDDGEMTTFTSAHMKNTTLFPHLHYLNLYNLSKLMHIGGGGGGALEGMNDASSNNTSIYHQAKELSRANVVPWSLCQYSREIRIYGCGKLSCVIPSYVVGQMQKLQKLIIRNCPSMMEVFETQGNDNNINNNNGGVEISTNFDEGISSTIYTTTLLTSRLNVPRLSLLNDVSIISCHMLPHVFTFSTLKSLTQLKTLKIKRCNALKVIVKEETDEGQTTNCVVDFPRLKCIELFNLPNLVGFFIGMNDFQWSSLEKVVIDRCPLIHKFTGGHSLATKLSFMHTLLGKHSLECGLNFHVLGTSQQTPFSNSNHSSCCHSPFEVIPWSFHNLIELNWMDIHKKKIIIPSNKLLQLHKLEKICLSFSSYVEEVFEALNETNSCSSESKTVVKLPDLRVVEIYNQHQLRYIWKSNQWTVFEFQNLTRVSITDCKRLEHVFTFSMVGSLLKLQDLHISNCRILEVIVMEEEVECDAKVKEVVELPCLKSLHLNKLPCLKGFDLGKEAFSLPSLDTLEITECPALTVFTKGGSTTPKLKIIDTSFGRCYINEDLNSFIHEKK